MNESLDQKIRYRNAVARAHSQVVSGQTSKLMVKEAPVYSGRSLEIFPIVLANLVLSFLTVGLYRFWAKTRIRRYFVSRVSFLGDPLEYSGTGMELFIGFLIVVAVLVPFSIATGFLRNFLVRPGIDPMSILLFQAAYLLVFYFLYNVAVYRAQRYRLSRMSWRGIRGGQQGSALLYAVYAMGLGLLTLLTLGLTYPILRRILVGYRINRACFGTATFRFSGSMGRLFGAWLVPWLIAATLMALVTYILWGTEIQRGGAAQRLETDLLLALERGKYALLPLAILLPVAYVWYRAVELRQWIDKAGFDRLEFKSRLNLLHILVPYLAYLTVLGLAVGGAGFGIGILIGGDVGPAAGTNKDTLIVMGAAAFAVIWLAGGLLKPVIVQNWLLYNICRTLTIQGTFSPDTLFQNQLEIPRRGEGLADALDVDAF
jgi:uncharacterized membrane protein YjgN (DUF898 family)